MMIEDLSSGADAYQRFRANEINFITFNSDRSLDYYIFDSFQDILPHPIKMRANSIQLVDARNPDPKKMTDIHRIINNRAESVFFLGFGFAEENLYVLDIPRSLQGKSVYGTAKGYTSKEIDRVREKLSGSLHL